MNGGVPNLPDELAGRPICSTTQILRLPFLKSHFPFRVQPGPSLWFAVDATTPRFRSKPGTEALLGEAKLLVQRVGAQFLEYPLRSIRIRVHQILRREQSKS